MRNNENGEFGVPKVSNSKNKEMEAFDSLRREFRDELNGASFKVSAVVLAKRAHQFNISTLRNSLKLATKLNAAAVYGPDHPQSK